MSEVVHHSPKNESLPHHEASNEALKQHLEALKRQAEADSEAHTDEEMLKSIKSEVEQSAVSKDAYNKTESSADNAPAATYISKELKAMGGRRVLTTARLHLKAPARAFSKVIHQPVVEKVSEVAGPTVARPSGILGGGIAALLGSSFLLYVTKHYGYRYNYFVFIMLFVGGFAVGMLVELLIRALFARKRA